MPRLQVDAVITSTYQNEESGVAAQFRIWPICTSDRLKPTTVFLKQSSDWVNQSSESVNQSSDWINQSSDSVNQSSNWINQSSDSSNEFIRTKQPLLDLNRMIG